MPLQTSTKERIYLLIMVLSLMLCAVLLISVFCDLPVASVSASSATHIPAMRAMPPLRGSGSPGAPAGGMAAVTVTEDDLVAQIIALLPAGFPVSELDIDISALGLELAVSRAALEQSGRSLTFGDGVLYLK